MPADSSRTDEHGGPTGNAAGGDSTGDRCGPPSENGGEDPLKVTLLATLAALLQFSLPPEYATRPPWLIPVVALVLSALVFVTHRRGGIGTHTKETPPDQADKEDLRYRSLRLALVGLLAVANAVSGARLVVDVLQADQSGTASRLLLSGVTIWVTNIIVFSLWYWELDWKGPWYRINHWHPPEVACDNGSYPDFLFPQMQDGMEHFRKPDWRPEVLDYLYLSFTNAAAFSPTDVLPLTRPAKMTMLVQSAISLAALALLVSRAVNVLT